MVFKSDRQRRGFFSNKRDSRSDTRPKIVNCDLFLRNKIRKNIREGKPRSQAIAIAFSQARKAGCPVAPRKESFK